MTVHAPRRGAAGAVTLVTFLAVACAPGPPPGDGAAPPAPPDAGTTTPTPTLSAAPAPDPEGYAAQLVATTNAVRDAEGVPSLRGSACAVDQARQRAAALVGAPLEHAPLDAVVAACAPPGDVAAENLSRTAADPDAVVDAWMGSHGHRANLLDPTLTEVGIACVPDPSDGAGALVCAQVFLG